jgi:hypothetical protein
VLLVKSHFPWLQLGLDATESLRPSRLVVVVRNPIDAITSSYKYYRRKDRRNSLVFRSHALVYMCVTALCSAWGLCVGRGGEGQGGGGQVVRAVLEFFWLPPTMASLHLAPDLPSHACYGARYAFPGSLTLTSHWLTFWDDYISKLTQAAASQTEPAVPVLVVR